MPRKHARPAAQKRRAKLAEKMRPLTWRERREKRDADRANQARRRQGLYAGLALMMELMREDRSDG